MKKLFILLFTLLLSTTAFSAEYGILDNIENYAPLTKRLLFLDNISYCTYTGKKGTDAETLSLFFKAAFNRWTLGVADHIEKAGRAEEFPFAMKVLKKPIKLEYIGECSKQNKLADIALVSGVEGCRKNIPSHYISINYPHNYLFEGEKVLSLTALNARSSICIAAKLNTKDERASLQIIAPIKINFAKISKEKYNSASLYIENLAQGIVTPEPEYLTYHSVFRTMCHEMGHAFGLSDEYGISNQKKNASSSPYRGDGLMNHSYFMKDDDVNGIITLIYSLGNRTISFKPFGDMPGMIIDNKFVLPVDEGKLSQTDIKKLKQSVRISDKEYKKIMNKYTSPSYGAIPI